MELIVTKLREGKNLFRCPECQVVYNDRNEVVALVDPKSAVVLAPLRVEEGVFPDGEGCDFCQHKWEKLQQLTDEAYNLAEAEEE